MAGATAATAAGVTASHAAAITVNLLNNYISSSGGNHLNADLTGDGQPDLTIANPTFFSRRGTVRSYTFSSRAGVSLNGVRASAFFENTSHIGILRIGSKSIVTSNFGVSLTGTIPIFFKDLRINSGARTRGSLEVTAFEGEPAEVQLDSFTYTTPDQGRSLALLAMGAGGIFALRRWEGRARRLLNPERSRAISRKASIWKLEKPRRKNRTWSVKFLRFAKRYRR
jgi:hypothetical protein